MKARIGPEITIRKSCSGCKYCVTEHYHVQGDSGFDKYCCHPTFEERRYIGLSWNTPDFCPEDKHTREIDEGEIEAIIEETVFATASGFSIPVHGVDKAAKAIAELYRKESK